jgi:hypothetical protein
VLAYLKGSRDLIHQRMAARHEHFMPIALLDSQFATLEEPTPDEHPIVVDVGGKPTEIARQIVRQLEERQHQPAGLRQSPHPARERTDDHVTGVVAPITTGYIVEATQSFTAAFLLAGIVLVIRIVAYVFILGRLEPIVDPPAA